MKIYKFHDHMSWDTFEREGRETHPASFLENSVESFDECLMLVFGGEVEVDVEVDVDVEED